MATASTAIQGTISQDHGPWQMAVDQLHDWREAIYRFGRWEHERILIGEPTQKEREEHRSALKWLLRGSKVLLALMSDPEFPDRAGLKALEAQIWQMESSWRMIYEPMAAEEAEKILQQAFPGKPE